MQAGGDIEHRLPVVTGDQGLHLGGEAMMKLFELVGIFCAGSGHLPSP